MLEKTWELKYTEELVESLHLTLFGVTVMKEILLSGDMDEMSGVKRQKNENDDKKEFVTSIDIDMIVG